MRGADRAPRTPMPQRRFTRRRCNLAVPPCTDDISFVERYANWLALWTCHVMPDARVQGKALDVARRVVGFDAIRPSQSFLEYLTPHVWRISGTVVDHRRVVSSAPFRSGI